MRLPLACASAVLSTCLPAFQLVCPDVYLFACLPASLFITFVHLFAAFLSAFLPAFQPVYLSFCPLVCLSSSLPSSQSICPLVYLFGFLSASLSAIRPILLSTCLFAYQPAFKMSFLPEFSACIPVLLSAWFNCYLPSFCNVRLASSCFSRPPLHRHCTTRESKSKRTRLLCILASEGKTAGEMEEIIVSFTLLLARGPRGQKPFPVDHTFRWLSWRPFPCGRPSFFGPQRERSMSSVRKASCRSSSVIPWSREHIWLSENFPRVFCVGVFFL